MVLEHATVAQSLDASRLCARAVGFGVRVVVTRVGLGDHEHAVELVHVGDAAASNVRQDARTVAD